MTSPMNKSTDSSNGTNKTTHTNERNNNTTTHHRNRQRLLSGEGRRNRHTHHKDSQPSCHRRLHPTGPSPTLSRTLVRRRSMLPLRRLQPRKIHLRSPNGRRNRTHTKRPLRRLRTLRQTIPTPLLQPRHWRTPHLSRRPVQSRNQPIRHRCRRLRRTTSSTT